jgi:TetR/AcrR family transcriptional regulator
MPKETFYNLPEEKQSRILGSAVREFAANPYKVASISSIVRKAGIAKGSFYQYFVDKKDLYHYLLELGSDHKLDLMKEHPAPDPEKGIFGYLRWQFLIAVYFEIHHPHLAEMTYRAFVEEVPFPEMTAELRRRGTTQFYKQLLSQGLLHSEVAPWVDTDMAAFLMEVVFYQFGKYFIKRLDLTDKNINEINFFEHKEAQQLLSNLMDILEAGMKRDPQQRNHYFNKD